MTAALDFDKVLRYAQAAKDAGCPADQVANLLRAAVVLHPKQLLASAAARACDLAGGPSYIGFGGARGGGKAINVSTHLPTPSGWTTMGEVEVGDYLFDEEGFPCRVMATSDVMYDHDVYEVVFDDGSVIEADAEHLWFTTTKKERVALKRRSEAWRAKRRESRPSRGTGANLATGWYNSKRAAEATLAPAPKGGIRTTRQIRDTLIHAASKPEINHCVSVAKPLFLPQAELPIDPYVLGVWLGDGNSNGGGLTSDDCDKEVRDAIEEAGHSVTKWQHRYMYGIGDLAGRLRRAGLINNKHIPPEYLRASEWQRWALLCGLMDTDGTALPSGQCEFYNCNKRLIDDAHELLISLGIKCSIGEGRATLNGEDYGLKYRIKFTTSESVFRLTRKAERQAATDSERRNRRYIVAVNPIPSVPVKCVTVDSPSHLYLAGRAMIPTHNSHWMVAQIGVDDCQRAPGLKCLILRKIAKSAKEGFGDLARRIFAHTPYTWKDREGVLTFPNDSRIIIGNFKDENDIDDYLGLEYDLIGVEEATTLSQSKIKNIDSCKRTSKPNFRPRMYLTTNPGGISHSYFKKRFIIPSRNGAETDTRFIRSLATDNPSLNDEYVRDVLSQYTGWQRRAWAEGDWDIEAGQYFTNFCYETHVRSRKTFELPTHWDVWCGLDHGLTHYTTVYLLAKDDDGHLYCLDEHAERGWLPSQHAAAIKAMLGRWEIPLEKVKTFAAGHDCFAKRVHDEEIGTIADDYRKEGITLVRASIDRINGAKELYRRLGNPSDENTTSSLLIRPTLTILDSCARLIECIPSLQRDPKRPEDVLKVDCDPDTGDGGDDPYDGFRHAYMEEALSSRNPHIGPSIAGPRRDFASYKPR